jgi:hypothetical protein
MRVHQSVCLSICPRCASVSLSACLVCLPIGLVCPSCWQPIPDPSCAGPNLEYLYVTTRQEVGDGASPNHGGLFRASIPGVRGANAAYEFELN